MAGKQHHQGSLVWPVILIGAGVVFLLNTLKIVDWNVWLTLLSLWPVLLIAIGLDLLIGRRSAWGSAAVAVLMLAVLAAAVWLGIPKWGGAGQVEQIRTVSEPLQGAESAAIEIGFGTGNLNLSALPADSGDLISGELDLSRGENTRWDVSGTSKRRLSLTREGGWSSWAPFMQAGDKAWDLELNRDVPVTLRIDSGVGVGTLELAQLNLTGLDIENWVGVMSVNLPANGRYDVEVHGGAGQVTFVLPQGLAASIRTSGGLGGVTVTGDFDRHERGYTSRDYATAENRVDIELRSGVGRLVVRQAVE